MNVARCLFEKKTDYQECRQAECLHRWQAGCCAVCPNKDYCKAMCPWVQQLRDDYQDKKERRRR